MWGTCRGPAGRREGRRAGELAGGHAGGGTCSKTLCSYPYLSLGLFVMNQVGGTNWGGGPN